MCNRALTDHTSCISMIRKLRGTQAPTFDEGSSYFVILFYKDKIKNGKTALVTGPGFDGDPLSGVLVFG